MKEHRGVLNKLKTNGLLCKDKLPFGKRMVMVYKPAQKGIHFVEVLYDHMKECLQEPGLSPLSIMAKKKNTMISFFESGKV